MDDSAAHVMRLKAGTDKVQHLEIKELRVRLNRGRLQRRCSLSHNCYPGSFTSIGPSCIWSGVFGWSEAGSHPVQGGDQGALFGNELIGAAKRRDRICCVLRKCRRSTSRLRSWGVGALDTLMELAMLAHIARMACIGGGCCQFGAYGT